MTSTCLNLITTKASFLVLGATVATALASAPALAAIAAPDIYFYPTQAWSTTTQSASNGNQCTIGNLFNNGFTMNVTGNSRWVQSVDIDFKQSAFESGKAYDVALAIPGKSPIVVKGQATNASVLSLSLQGNKDLYKQIGASSVFDFTVDENQFRFYMVGFSAKAPAFERCMAGASPQKNSPMQVANVPVQNNTTNDKRPTSGLVVNARDSKALNAEPTINETMAMEQRELTIREPITVSMPAKPIVNVPVATQVASKIPTPVAPIKTAPKNAGQEIAVDLSTPINDVTGKPKHRLSEKISKQILNNPELVEMENKRPSARTASVNATLTSEDKMMPLPIGPQKPEIAAIKSTTKAKTINKSAIDATIEKQKTADLTTPEIIITETSTPKVTKTQITDVITEKSSAPVQNDIDILAIENSTAKPLETADDLNAKYLTKTKSVKSRIKVTKSVTKGNVDLTGAQMKDNVQKDKSDSASPTPLARENTKTTPIKNKAANTPNPAQNIVAVTKADDANKAKIPAKKTDVIPEAEKSSIMSRVKSFWAQDKETTPPTETVAVATTTPAAPKKTLKSVGMVDTDTIKATPVAPVKTVPIQTAKAIPPAPTPIPLPETAPKSASMKTPEPSATPKTFTPNTIAIDTGKMTSLERRLALLEAENKALNDDLRMALSESKQEGMTISNENWNLERATMRFNEAERQLQRMGQQLQAERTKHKMEVQELETMLFDPQVTEQAQLARLADMERELMAARAKLRELEGR